MTSSWWQRNPFNANDSEENNDELYSSHSESENESDENQQQQKQTKSAPASATSYTKAPTKYKIDSDSEGEKERRTIKTAKEKQYEEMQKIVKNINNHIKINDWNAIYTEWEKLNKVYAKTTTTSALSTATRSDKEGPPRIFLKILVTLENFIKTIETEKPKMSLPNTKAFNIMKQKFKKWLKTNSELTKFMDDYRNNPLPDEDEENEFDDDAGLSTNAVSKESAKTTKHAKKETTKELTKKTPAVVAPAKDPSKWFKKPGQKSESESDEESWSPDESSDEDETLSPKKSIPSKQKTSDHLDKSSESEASDVEPNEVSKDDSATANKASKWLMKTKDTTSKPSKKTKKERKEEKKSQKLKKDKEPEEEVTKETEHEHEKEAEKQKEETWTAEKVDQKLKELLANRGKKNYDRLKQVDALAYLVTKAKSVEQELRVLFALIFAQFDASPNMANYMSIDMWKSTYNNLVKIIQLLRSNPHIELKEMHRNVITLLGFDTDDDTGEGDEQLGPEEKRGDAAADTDRGSGRATSATSGTLNESVAALSSSSAVGSGVGGRGNEVIGHLMAAIERLDAELIKSLQFLDPNSLDYRLRLADEANFLKLARFALDYYETQAKQRLSSVSPASVAAPPGATTLHERIARIAARRLDHLYYKRERPKSPTSKGEGQVSSQSQAQSRSLTPAQQQADSAAIQAAGISEQPQQQLPQQPSTRSSASSGLVAVPLPEHYTQLSLTEEVEEMCQKIYRWGDDRLKRTAMLQQIYFLAHHDRYFEARDMLLMSHLQDTIQHADIPTQVLFNRTMVQLGLAAFRQGRIQDAHTCLNEIMTSGKVKELLAQGVSVRYQGEKTPEQERLEKRRQIPYHMHINLELLECAYLVCAMLLEVPNMAANFFDPKRKIISKNFRKALDSFERQVISGPPENTREHVIAAAKALSRGHWRVAASLLLPLDVWKLFVNEGSGVKEMLRQKLQEEGLRTYLLTYARYYDSLSLRVLCDMFELPSNTVHSIVSKMMSTEELQASWDQPSASIVMHHTEPTKLQYLALQFAEKAAVLVESEGNEETRDTRRSERVTSTRDAEGRRLPAAKTLLASAATSRQAYPFRTATAFTSTNQTSSYATRSRNRY
jgi:translation initiation factor 3 subunit C